MLWKPSWHPLCPPPHTPRCGCLRPLGHPNKNLGLPLNENVGYHFPLPAVVLKGKSFVLKLEIGNWKCWVDSLSVFKNFIFGQVFWIIFVMGFIRSWHYTGWGKSRFTVVSLQSLFLYYYLLITVLFSIWTSVNLLLPHPILEFVVATVVGLNSIAPRLPNWAQE